MTGNAYLDRYFSTKDLNTCLCQIIDDIRNHNTGTIDELQCAPTSDYSEGDEEYIFIVVCSAVIEWACFKYNEKRPDWVMSDKLIFKYPFYLDSRLSDFDKIRLYRDTPAPIRRHNVFIDKAGLERI